MTPLSESIMHCRDIVDEVFGDYKDPSMLIAAKSCDWKCCKELNLPEDTCQNHALIKNPLIEISFQRLYERYKKNGITKAIIFGGLEPILQFDEVLGFIKYLREECKCDDPVIIYTGYYIDEIAYDLYMLCDYSHIIVKSGRYIPGEDSRYDETLGVTLSSSNQFSGELTEAVKQRLQEYLQKK